MTWQGLEPLFVAFCICQTPEVAGCRGEQAFDREAELRARKTENMYPATLESKA